MEERKKIYPRTGDRETIYLNSVITNPNILVGEYTMYNDFVDDPVLFEKNNVLYQYPINHDKLVIGRFCSIACGAKFLFNSANHRLASLSTYPFPLFFEEWGLEMKNVAYVVTRSTTQRSEEVYEQMDLYTAAPHVAAVSLWPGSEGYEFWRSDFVQNVRRLLEQQ